MTLTTCPRCSGFPRAFARCSNVNDGRCLLCNGALMVKAAPIRTSAPRPAPAPRKGKRVALPSVSATAFVWISPRGTDGEFPCVFNCGHDERQEDCGSCHYGELPFYVAINCGRVVAGSICNGLAEEMTPIVADMQAAHRATRAA